MYITLTHFYCCASKYRLKETPATYIMGILFYLSGSVGIYFQENPLSAPVVYSAMTKGVSWSSLRFCWYLIWVRFFLQIDYTNAMRALEFRTGHIILKLHYHQIYQLKSTVNFTFNFYRLFITCMNSKLAKKTNYLFFSPID